MQTIGRNIIQKQFFTNKKTWLKQFIFEQKCVPWRVFIRYCNIRNRLFNINTQRHWDKTWMQEKDLPKSYRFYPKAFSEIIKIIPHRSKVLDIGCGIGILMDRLKKEKDCNVLGADISKQAINILREKGMCGIIAKIPPIPLSSNSFDVIIATELLEHLNNPENALKEMFRILKPYGILVITVPDDALKPYTERDHVNTFDKEKIYNLFKRIIGIESIAISRVKEEAESFYRLIIKVEKCRQK